MSFRHGEIGMTPQSPSAIIRSGSDVLMFHSQIFPNYSSALRPVCKNSAFARIKEKRLEMRRLELAIDNSNI
jgi:hypothetical protein